MIDIKLIERNGMLVGFDVRGHAGYLTEGKDIVCAGVSTLAYTFINAVEAIAGLKVEYRIEDGSMMAALPVALTKEQRNTASIILETIITGFKQIENQYGEYVHIFLERG